MKTIHLVIDDKPIVAPEGTNIFQAALDNGIHVPGLCYHPKLSQFGGCRLCVVEVTERRTGHRFACAHPVSEGMVVKVNTPKVVRYRKAVMEYLLAHHPLDCPTCDKSGECGLQDITHELNLPSSRFKTVRMNVPMIRDNPLLELNRNRCILCGRCVTLCKEVEGLGAIDFQNRGIKTVIGTALDRPLECSFCGGCVSVCPTGAWQDRTPGFQGRSWDFKKVPTLCPYCSIGCTVVLNVKSPPVCFERGGEKVVRVTSDDYTGFNEGNLCVKGRFGYDFIHASERIKTPFVRKNGELCPVSWDEAIDSVAKKFQQIVKEHGGMAIGGIGSEKATNEDNYLFQKFCRSVLGTNNIDNMANMKSPVLNSLIYESVTHGIASTSLKEIEKATTLFFLGADITEAIPVIGNMARKAIRLNGADIIIAHIRNVTFNSIAKHDVRLLYALGSQVDLVNVLMKVIISEKLVDTKKVETSTSGFPEILAFLKKLNVNKILEKTGVAEESIKNAARLLARPGNCFIVCGEDVEEDPQGEDTIRSLMSLCVLINTGCSQEGAAKVSLLFTRRHNNSQGVNDMGVVPNYLPGYLDIRDSSHRERLENVWGAKLPADIPAAGAVNLVALAARNELKALYVMGENPVLSHRNGKEIRDALKKTGFLVVQDTFLTETAQLADVVFPSATFAEKEGTFTNMGLTVQRLNKAIVPIDGAKPDWQIICELAKKMGHSYSYATSKDVLNEIEGVVLPYSGINYDRLKRKGFHWGASVVSGNAPGKYTFCVPRQKNNEIKKGKDFPFILLTGSSLNHQGSFSRHSKSLVSVAPECFVEINRKDAQELQLQNGDMVVVESPQGSLSLKAKVVNKSPIGMVFVPMECEWLPINLLCDRVYTPVKICKAEK